VRLLQKSSATPTSTITAHRVHWLGYGLDDRGIVVQVLRRASDFIRSRAVQRACGAHPDSYPVRAVGGSTGGEPAGA
jgi:hypothetical protein